MSVEVKMFSLNSLKARKTMGRGSKDGGKEGALEKTVSLFDVFIKVAIVKVLPTHFSFELRNALRLELLSHFTDMQTKPRPSVAHPNIMLLESG